MFLARLLLLTAPMFLVHLLLLTAPTILVLVAGWWVAETPRQRILNLVLGFLFAIGAAASVAFSHPTPGSWIDRNYGSLVFTLAPIGAALGVALAIGSRHLARRRK